jgi:hypothetical protein
MRRPSALLASAIVFGLNCHVDVNLPFFDDQDGAPVTDPLAVAILPQQSLL